MGKRRLWLYAAATGVVSVAAGAACNSETSGACDGAENGKYFQLQTYNYLDGENMTARINGRFIGDIPQPSPVATGTPYPGEKLLGEFPHCDKNIFDARGSGGNFTDRVCATAKVNDPTCVSHLQDYCWLTVFVLPQATQLTADPTDLQANQCEAVVGDMTCNTSNIPGSGTGPCFPCLGMWINNC